MIVKKLCRTFQGSRVVLSRSSGHGGEDASWCKYLKMNEEGYDTGLGEPGRDPMGEYGEVDDEDEMVATERELAEDAQWKKIQQNTFTRWANEHLKTVQKHIGNLETDLSDGLRLITLIEVLSGRRLPKHNKRPSFRSQKLENVSVALKFLQDDEGIRIVNIGESKSKVFAPVTEKHRARFGDVLPHTFEVLTAFL